MRYHQSTKETHFNFLLRILSEPFTDDCMLWPFQVHDGYGFVWVPEIKLKTKVHRVAFWAYYGAWPDPCGCHACDTPLCFNPLHQFIGTIAVNNADMLSKGRARWQTNGNRPNGLVKAEQRAFAKKYCLPLSENENLWHWLQDAVAKHNSDDCLLWPFPVTNTGFPRLRIDGRKVLAHKAAYRLIHGCYPEPCGMHSCNNDLCINPRHVYPGTKRDTIAKRDARGRQWDRKGEANGSAKINAEVAREIRVLYASGDFSQMSLAAKFGVHQTAISAIIRRFTWGHVI